MLTFGPLQNSPLLSTNDFGGGPPLPYSSDEISKFQDDSENHIKYQNDYDFIEDVQDYEPY